MRRVGQTHLCLVVKNELLELQRFAQPRLQMQSMCDPCVDLRRIEPVRFGRVFGALERGLSIDEQPFRGIGIAWIQRDADLDGDTQLDSLDQQRLGQRFDDPLVDPARHVLTWKIRNHDGESVATDARGCGGLAGCAQ